MRSKQTISGCCASMVEKKYIIVGSCWIIGLISGFFVAAMCADDCGTTLIALARLQPSLLQLCALRLAPVLAFAMCIHWQPLAMLVVWGKGTLFTFCLSDIARTFLAAGWIVQPLLLFSDFVATVVFLWFSIRSTESRKQTIFFDVVLCSIIIFIACIIDYNAVSPYLMMLLDS